MIELALKMLNLSLYYPELGSILATFMVISRIVRSSYFSKLFQPPVVLDRN